MKDTSQRVDGLEQSNEEEFANVRGEAKAASEQNTALLDDLRTQMHADLEAETKRASE